MFTQDLDATASYRTLARGFGCGWARTYRVAQQCYAGYGNSVPREADAPRRSGGRMVERGQAATAVRRGMLR